jgi:GNAT superfamily N-acetyltransferase
MAARRSPGRAARPGTGALTFHPLTPDRWDDLATLFGPRGAQAGCWCMWWRQTQAEFQSHRGEANRRALQALVRTGQPPGVLAYADGTAIGWCAIGPRAGYARLSRSRVLAPVDDRPVWAVTCFFVARPWRGRGVTRPLLEAAVAFARSRGATDVEGYPLDVADGYPDAYAYTGLVSAFQAAGFHEVARRSPTRPLMRRPLATLETPRRASRTRVPGGTPRPASSARRRSR